MDQGASSAGPVVLLVSLDTTRADALSCYAEQSSWGLDLEKEHRVAARTPILDGLAERGVKFNWALSHAPSTLNAHTSVFSGLDPHQHGVPRNGFPVGDDIALFPERLAAAGWEVIGVIGASVLERRMRLDRGFDVYDDAVGTKVRHRFEDPADVVNERVKEALDNRTDPSRPLFLFVHYFDAHSPWNTAPLSIRKTFVDPAYQGAINGSAKGIGEAIQKSKKGELSPQERRQVRGHYLGEVSWVDLQLGVLLEDLRARGYMDDALVVVFGDHGETMEEIPQRPYGHTLDADLGSLHVPLLISGTGRYGVPVGTSVEHHVRLMDIGPTILGQVGLETIGSGRDLSFSWQGQSGLTPPSFGEATKPFQDVPEGAWPNLDLDRSVTFDGHMLTRAPYLDQPPALFRLAPGQPAAVDADRMNDLLNRLQVWDTTAPGAQTPDLHPQTEAALRGLGYIE